MDFHVLMKQSFFNKLYIRAFTIIINDLKIFHFRVVPFKVFVYGSFHLVFLKWSLFLMPDWNSVSNPEFFMLIHTSFHIFCAKNLGAISYSLSISKFSSSVFFISDKTTSKPKGIFREGKTENYQSRTLNNYEAINQVVLKQIYFSVTSEKILMLQKRDS